MSEPVFVPRAAAPASRPRPSARRTIVGIAVVIAIAIVLALILSHCAKSGAKPGPGGRGGAGASGPGGRPAITVAVAKAALGDIPIQLSALGAVTPVATVDVNARVAGMLVKVDFQEGQLVRKGQLLAQIDPRPFQVAVDQAQGQLMRDLALLSDARVSLARYRTLVTQDSIATQTADTQASLVKQDEGTVVSDRANLANAKLNLSFTRIPAPVSGRVGLRQVDPGNQITANSATPIVVVTQIAPIDVVFSLPEDAIPGVTGDHGRGSGLPVTALDRAGGTALAQGVLSTLDNVIDTTTGTVKAKARFSNPNGALFPSQFVNVVMLVNTLTNQVIVPTTATRHGPQGDFVWVLQPNQTVNARTVVVGPGTAETVSITSGLKVGETVITEGGDRLREGGKVVLPGQRPSYGGRGGHGGHHRHGGGGGGGAPSGG
ncbi:MAG TPA: MdtA/MuxA family multidrug efflux RND transporter periplasmic adaptor subunit [Caulobacteraceae bacterium]